MGRILFAERLKGLVLAVALETRGFVGWSWSLDEDRRILHVVAASLGSDFMLCKCA